MNSEYALLFEVLNSREEFKDLKLNGTILSYNNKKINLKDLNLNYFLSQNPNFKNDLPNMTPEAIFNILTLHLEYVKADNAKKAQKFIDKTPLLKQFAVIKRTDNNKNEYSYIHYKDDKGINHVLAGCDYKELIEAYETIELSDNLLKTDKDIFNLLKEKYDELVLEDLHTAEQRPNVSEQHLNNLKKMHEDNNSAMELSYEIVGNEQHHVYINNGKVMTIDVDLEGKVVEEKHENETTETEAIDKVEIEDETNLISFNEYVNLIYNKEFLSNDEKDKIKAYEDFLFDVITYKDYLTPELYDIYQRWVDFYQKLYYVPVQTQVIQDALKRYGSMQERSEKVEITNSRDEVLKLSKKNPGVVSSGYVGATIYIILTIILGIIIGTLLFRAS